MARKRKLSELIGEETKQTNNPESEATDSVSSEVSNSVSLKVTKSQTDKETNSESDRVTELQTNETTNSSSLKLTESQTDKEPDLQTLEVPKYLTLVRKEARLREDQLNNLTSLTRSLNRKRRGTGERITENTLIRVAVDLLLNKSDELKGSTEQEIKKSVGLKVTD